MKYACRAAEMSFPIPAYIQHIPVVSPNAGNKEAYLIPDSPEAIIQQTAKLRAQAAVDSIYDVPTKAFHENVAVSNAKKEGFGNCNRGNTMQILLVFTVLLFILLVSRKNLRYTAKIYILSAAVLLILLVIAVYSRDV